MQKKLTSTKPWKSSKKRAKKVTTLVQANPRKRNPLAAAQAEILRELNGLVNRPYSASVARRVATLKAKLSRTKNPIPAALVGKLAKFATSAGAGYVGAKLAAKKTVTAFRRGEKKVAAKKANPKHASPAARKTFAMFHGTKPRKKTIYKATRAKLPGANFAKIGDLVSLTVGNHKVSFDKDKVSPIVVTDAKAKRLFFLGGNQNLSGLKPVKKANPGGLHDLGEVSMLEYFSRKKFDQFNPTVYYHELGEENGIRPRLMYDPKARQMYLVGGDYKIKPEGIVN